MLIFISIVIGVEFIVIRSFLVFVFSVETLCFSNPGLLTLRQIQNWPKLLWASSLSNSQSVRRKPPILERTRKSSRYIWLDSILNVLLSYNIDILHVMQEREKKNKTKRTQFIAKSSQMILIHNGQITHSFVQ